MVYVLVFIVYFFLLTFLFCVISEVLEALECGEMKFESNGSISSCSEDEDEDEEVDPLTVDTPNTPSVGSNKVSHDYYI